MIWKNCICCIYNLYHIYHIYIVYTYNILYVYIIYSRRPPLTRWRDSSLGQVHILVYRWQVSSDCCQASFATGYRLFKGAEQKHRCKNEFSKPWMAIRIGLQWLLEVQCFKKTSRKSEKRAGALNVYKPFPHSVQLSKTTKLKLLDSLLQEVCIVTSEFTRAWTCVNLASHIRFSGELMKVHLTYRRQKEEPFKNDWFSCSPKKETLCGYPGNSMTP